MKANNCFCINCMNWVDKLYSYKIVEKNEEKTVFLCQKCLLEEAEVESDSELMHYAFSKDILEDYIIELKTLEGISDVSNKDVINQEVCFLEGIILPALNDRIEKLKNCLN